MLVRASTKKKILLNILILEKFRRKIKKENRKNYFHTMGNSNHSKKKGSTVLTEEEMGSLMNSTSFTREEILNWHDGFIVSYNP